MISEENIQGYWHLPAHPGQQFTGTLNFGPNASPRLHITAAPGSDLSVFSYDTGDYAIWGVDLKGQPITLFGCNRLSIGGSPDTTFNASEIIFGGHVPDAEQPFFDSVRFSFDGLEDWVNIWGHNLEIKAKDNYNLSYKKPADIPFTINDNLHGCITFWNNLPQYHLAETEVHQNTLFKFFFAQKVSTEKLLEQVWTLQQLITLFMFEQTKVKWIYGERDGREYRLFYRQKYTEKEYNGRTLFLLPYRVVAPLLEKTISRWMILTEKLSPITGILHANIDSSGEFVHNNFLNIVQAVEAFHRRLLQDTEQLKNENQVLVARLLDQIACKEDKEWLEARLAYSYEPNLRLRLKELIAKYQEVLFTDQPPKKSINRLISNVVEKRNYFTHYGSSPKKKENEISQIIGLTTFLKMLLAFCVLDEIGVPPDILKDNIYNRFRFRI